MVFPKWWRGSFDVDVAEHLADQSLLGVGSLDEGQSPSRGRGNSCSAVVVVAASKKC